MIVIGIDAMSFVGTTYLSMILGSHPRSMAVGHCYVYFKDFRQEYIIQRDKGCFICHEFNKKCILNPLVQIGHLIEPERAYNYIFNYLLPPNKDIIIDSSSTRSWFMRTKPAHMVTVFRHPVKLASSYIKHLWDDSRFNNDVDKILNYMCEAYNSYYSTALGHVIDHQNTISDTRELRCLFSKVGIEFEPSFFKYWDNEVHAISGNRTVLISMVKNCNPDRLPSLITEISKGFNKYEEYYHRCAGTKFDDTVDLLTEIQKELIMNRCNDTYKKLKLLEANLIV